MTDDQRTTGIPDEVDPTSQQTAADEQAAERERIEAATRREFHIDPGDPLERLDGASEDRLIQQRETRV
jgi:hypothetical protein